MPSDKLTHSSGYLSSQTQKLEDFVNKNCALLNMFMTQSKGANMRSPLSTCDSKTRQRNKLRKCKQVDRHWLLKCASDNNSKIGSTVSLRG